jgi:hypothetical protein
MSIKVRLITMLRAHFNASLKGLASHLIGHCKSWQSAWGARTNPIPAVEVIKLLQDGLMQAVGFGTW